MSNTTNLDNILYALGDLLHELFPPEDTSHNPMKESIRTFLNTAANSYVLVEWPELQEFMEEEWFQAEAVCAVGSEDRFGSATYFIPLKRVIN